MTEQNTAETWELVIFVSSTPNPYILGRECNENREVPVHNFW